MSFLCPTNNFADPELGLLFGTEIGPIFWTPYCFQNTGSEKRHRFWCRKMAPDSGPCLHPWAPPQCHQQVSNYGPAWGAAGRRSWQSGPTQPETKNTAPSHTSLAKVARHEHAVCHKCTSTARVIGMQTYERRHHQRRHEAVAGNPPQKPCGAPSFESTALVRGATPLGGIYLARPHPHRPLLSVTRSDAPRTRV